MEKGRLMTLKEVADFVGVSKKTIITWIHAEKIVAFKVDKTYRVFEKDFQEFLKAHTE
jgi:excisionase family DNA binding protein